MIKLVVYYNNSQRGPQNKVDSLSHAQKNLGCEQKKPFTNHINCDKDMRTQTK